MYAFKIFSPIDCLFTLSSPFCKYMFICILSSLYMFIFLSGLLFLWSYFKINLCLLKGRKDVLYFIQKPYCLSIHIYICILSGIKFELCWEIGIRVNTVTFVFEYINNTALLLKWAFFLHQTARLSLP